MLSSTSMAACQAAAFLFFFTVHIVPPVVCCRLKLSKTPEAPAAVCRHLQPAMPILFQHPVRFSRSTGSGPVRIHRQPLCGVKFLQMADVIPAKFYLVPL